ncbi:hypothetical protein NG895_24420 [Aeoliella sp. ICT_H6.2]|uniref:Uncharacterized protein n=1 Tax=Aeoliella straminimaris TaxID=2954799 RepID=A0A9X2FJE7_9BACT|nr:hypothetical protein [Aeoliella straminimaris]MCO6047056.1 hypothetical protein [Aeoliella straminimaris]
MKNGFANTGDETPSVQTQPGWSGKLGVWLLLGAVFTAFALVTWIVLTTPLTRNELGLLGGLNVEASEDTLVFVGDRYIGTGKVEISWNDLLGAAGRPPLAVPGDKDTQLAGPDAELVWSQQGPQGANRGPQDVDYSFRQQLYRRADGQFDQLFVIDCSFPKAEGQWRQLLIPVRGRKQGAAAAGYFPQPGLQGAGNVSRGMIPSRRDAATFQLKLQVRKGTWPKAVQEPTADLVLWQPERAEK